MQSNAVRYLSTGKAEHRDVSANSCTRRPVLGGQWHNRASMSGSLSSPKVQSECAVRWKLPNAKMVQAIINVF